RNCSSQNSRLTDATCFPPALVPPTFPFLTAPPACSRPEATRPSDLIPACRTSRTFITSQEGDCTEAPLELRRFHNQDQVCDVNPSDPNDRKTSTPDCRWQALPDMQRSLRLIAG